MPLPRLADSGPRTADSLAQTICHPRLVRVARRPPQVACGIRRGLDTYEPAPKPRCRRLDDTSPVFLARAMNTFGSMFMDLQKTATAFRAMGALSCGDHHPCLFSGTEWFFRPDTGLTSRPGSRALEGVEASPRRRTSPTSDADTGIARGDGHRVPELDLLRIRLPRTFDRDVPQEAREAAGWTPISRSRPRRLPAVDLIASSIASMIWAIRSLLHAREHLLPGGTVLLVESCHRPAPEEHRREPDGDSLLRHHHVSVRPTHCRRRWAQPRRPPARPGFARSSRKPVSITSGVAQTPMSLIIEARGVIRSGPQRVAGVRLLNQATRRQKVSSRLESPPIDHCIL